MASEDEVAITIQGVITRRSFIGGLLRYLTPRERTQILELCLARALEWFWMEYGKLRFQGYAKVELGYRITRKTQYIKQEAAKKNPDALLPNVRSGETRSDALNNWHVETRPVGGALSGLVIGVIKVQMPGYISGSSTKTGEILSKITELEGERICMRFFAEVMSASQRFNTSVTTRNGRMIPRATAGSSDAGMLGRSSRATFLTMRQSLITEARNG